MSGAWSRLSIGTRLILANAFSLTLILALFSAGVTFLFWRNLELGLHRELGREFEVIEGLIDKTAPGRFSFGPNAAHEEAEYEGEAIAAEVWGSKTERLGRTPAAQRLKLPKTETSPAWSESGFGVIDSAGEQVHVLQGLHEVGNQEFLIRVFRPDEPIRSTVTTLVWTIALGFMGVLSLAVFFSFRLVRRLFLTPLAKMAEAAAHMAEERSDHSVLPIDNPNDELGHLGAVFNDVLRRYDLAILRARRFSADASHELRTPLTSMRSVGEVALREEKSPEGYQDAIGSMLEDIDSLTGMLESLMLLSRADEGKVALARERVDVHQVVQGLSEDMTVLSDPKAQTLILHGEKDFVVALDWSVLRLALINLIDNAIKFAPKESNINVLIRRTDEELQIDVHNDGEPIPTEHQEAIFDRFYRIDLGRSRSAGGSGLGLSVARWAVEAHSGTLSVIDGVRSGVTFRIAIPLSSTESG